MLYEEKEHHLRDNPKCTLPGMPMFLLDRLLCNDTRAHDAIVAQSAIYCLICISLTQCILSVQQIPARGAEMNSAD